MYMEALDKRQIHLAESKALLEAVMNESRFVNEGRGIHRVGKMADNLNKLMSSKALDVANNRLSEFTAELNSSGMAEGAIVAEVEVYKVQLVRYLRSLIRGKI